MMPGNAPASSQHLETLPQRILCPPQVSLPGHRACLLRLCLSLERSLVSAFPLALAPQEKCWLWPGLYLWGRSLSGPCSLAVPGLPGFRLPSGSAFPQQGHTSTCSHLPHFCHTSPLWVKGCHVVLASLQMSSSQILLQRHLI